MLTNLHASKLAINSSIIRYAKVPEGHLSNLCGLACTFEVLPRDLWLYKF